MASPFSWASMNHGPLVTNTGFLSTVANNRHRSSDVEKVYEKLVPVQVQVSGGNDDRKQCVHLSVELVQAGMANSSFRKVGFSYFCCYFSQLELFQIIC